METLAHIRKYMLTPLRGTKRRSNLFFAFGLFFVALCLFCVTLTKKTTQELVQITDVKVQKQTLDLKKNSLDTISLVLNKDADIKLQIWNGNGYLMRNLVEGKAQKGVNYYAWDGKDDSGVKVADGDYYLTITAQTDGEETSYDPFKQSWGDPIEPVDFTLNRTDLRFHYTLPVPAMVRIRAGVSDKCLLYATVVNWEPRPAGANVEYWDGYDNSHLVAIAHKKDIEYIINAYTLPANAIIVKKGNPDSKIYAIKKEFPQKGYSDPKVLVSLADINKTEDGIPVVYGTTILRVELVRTGPEFMPNEQFEIMVFLDEELYLEQENCLSPHSLPLDISALAEGKHNLTAVIQSPADFAGSASMQFFVDKR